LANGLNASLVIENGYNLSPTQAQINNDGSLTVGANSSFTVTWVFRQSQTGGLIALAGGVTGLRGNATVDGLVANDGTLVTGSGSTVTVSGSYSQSGTLLVEDHSTLDLAGPFGNFSGGTLTAGTYVIRGTWQFTNAAVTTNAAALVLDGPHAQIADQSGNNALASFATNNGSFTLAGGRNFTTASDFANSGTLTLGPGLFAIHGNYSQAATGILNVALDGTSPGSGYGQLSVTGSATLLAGATLHTTRGFVSAVGDTFNILPAADGVSGIFNGLPDRHHLHRQRRTVPHQLPGQRRGAYPYRQRQRVRQLHRAAHGHCGRALPNHRPGAGQ
jgi:hypothetical protein